MHVQLLKLHTPRDSNQEVNRVTTVLEPDTATDDMYSQYTEVILTGSVQAESREADITGWESEFHDTLTKDVGTADLAEFKMDTGDHPTISQALYNTLQSLVDIVNKELRWLKDKGFIRESDSSWSSPMVTVKMPDGSVRICIDFKAINSITIHSRSICPGSRKSLSK